MLPVFLLALALATDAAAVSAAMGATHTRSQVAATAALVFGTFQAGMAALGALGGIQLARVLGAWLAVLAAVVLASLGLRMLRAPPEEEAPTQPTGRLWVSLGLATSVDALAAGVSLPLYDVPPPLSVVMIGGVTAAASGVAALAGRSLGAHFGARMQRLGGALLVALGAMALATLGSG